MQNDFCLESGSLYVKGATNALWNIEDLLYSGEIGEVWFTADWHDTYHPSFITQRGQWPIHCVQYSQGAAINDLLLTACRNNNIPYQVYEKGHDIEEYGAFTDLEKYDSSISWLTDNGLEWYAEVLEHDELIICGVAGDYCVLNTIDNLQPLWGQLSVFLPGIASIDGGETLAKFIKDNNIAIYEQKV